MTESITAVPRPKQVWWRALLIALPCLVVGFIAGAYSMGLLALRAKETQPGFVAMFDQHMVSQYAYLQYREASYEEARIALETYLKLLASPEQSQNPIADARTRRVDAILTWGRLALLHERNGRPDLAEPAWRGAETLARESAWRDPSELKIRSQLERIDSLESTMSKAHGA